MFIIYGNILLLVFVVGELAIMHFSKKQPVPWKEVAANLNSGHILLWIFRGLIVAAYLYIYQHLSFAIFEKWPEILVWLFGLIAWDFCFYWSHRLHHTFETLWAVHVLHHDSEHFNLSLGIRNSWYSTLTSFPFFSVLAFAGLPLEVFLSVSGIHYAIQFFNHSHLVRKMGWLEYVLITPSHHRVHHGRNDVYVNKNFGGTFLVWDKLFNTFQGERNDMPVEFGINDTVRSENPVVMSNRNFLKKFVAPAHSQEKSIHFPVYMVVSASMLLYSLLLCFINFETTIPAYTKLLLFTLLFLGTIANGSFSEGKLWGALSWVVITIVFGAAILIHLQSGFAILRPLIWLIVAHGLVMLFLVVRKPSMMFR